MKTNMQQNKKLYVLVSDKLTSIYGAVQGGHAVAQYMLDNSRKKNKWKNETIVYLKCNIKIIKTKLDIRGLDYSSWYEPDLDNELTAIAIYDDGYIFRNLKLLK